MSLNDYAEKFERLRAIERQRKDLDAERKELLADLVPAGAGTYRWNGTDVEVHKVQRTRVVANLHLLRQDHPDLYEEIVVSRLDSAKLAKSVDSGAWTPGMIEAYLTEVSDSPYFTFKEFVAAEDDVDE